MTKDCGCKATFRCFKVEIKSKVKEMRVNRKQWKAVMMGEIVESKEVAFCEG